MTEYRIIFWRDIPVQVNVRDGSARRSRQLSPRFQETVYRAAYRAKAITGDEYMREWRSSDWSERDGTVDAVLAVVTAELEREFVDEALNQLALNKGYDSNDN